jgi:hypothetical protein
MKAYADRANENAEGTYHSEVAPHSAPAQSPITEQYKVSDGSRGKVGAEV